MIPIKRVKGIEAQKNFEGISTPNDLANMMTRLLAVDDNDFLDLQEIIVSATEPRDTDRQKLWVKNSNPPALGLPIGGQYVMIYPYPPNIPILWVQGEDELPFYLRKLTAGELTDYNLFNPTNENVFYVILIPS